MILPMLMRVLMFPVGSQVGEVYTIAHLRLCATMIPLLSLDPIKGSGVGILDQSYVDKMMFILSDTSKFLRLGPADNFDHTASIETKFQRRLVELVKRGFLSSTIADQIRLTRSIGAVDNILKQARAHLSAHD